MNPEFSQTTKTNNSFFPISIDQMPEAPNRTSNHRRSHSDTFFRFPDDLLFDAPITFDSSNNAPSRPPISHFRSLSVEESADFFQGMMDSGDKSVAVDVPSSSGGRRPGLHRRNNSMDGASSSFEADSFLDGVKKVMTPDKLAELALLDPKRAKKILANRQSAARSKERKVQYTGELERKVQTLQSEATTLSTQVTMLQRDVSGLTAENRELKLRLQSLEQQAQLKDALNETLKQEVERLRIEAGQNPSSNGNAPNRSSNPFGIQQTQRSNIDQNSTKQLWPSFLDYKS